MLKVKEWIQSKNHQFKILKGSKILFRLADFCPFILNKEYIAHGYISGTKIIIDTYWPDMIHVSFDYESADGRHIGRGIAPINNLHLSGDSIYVKPPEDSKG